MKTDEKCAYYNTLLYHILWMLARGGKHVRAPREMWKCEISVISESKNLPPAGSGQAEDDLFYRALRMMLVSLARLSRE